MLAVWRRRVLDVESARAPMRTDGTIYVAIKWFIGCVYNMIWRLGDIKLSYEMAIYKFQNTGTNKPLHLVVLELR